MAAVVRKLPTVVSPQEVEGHVAEACRATHAQVYQFGHLYSTPVDLAPFVKVSVVEVDKSRPVPTSR